MGFLYFFPGASGLIKRSDFERRGLGYALAVTGEPECAALAQGPGDTPGVLASVVSATGAAAACAYKPAEQRWRKGPAMWMAGKELTWWVGIWTERKPGPDELARETVYPGNTVRLRDGRDWVIPRAAAILPERPSTLPRVLDLADDGETVVTREDPRFEAVSRDAFRFWMDWSGQSEEKDRLKGAEQVSLAVAALQVNYRIGKVEAISLLSLWGTDEFGLVLRALIDADELEAYAKKKAGEPSAAGEASSAPAT